jgi:hypothetical protein
VQRAAIAKQGVGLIAEREHAARFHECIGGKFIAPNDRPKCPQPRRYAPALRGRIGVVEEPLRVKEAADVPA